MTLRRKDVGEETFQAALGDRPVEPQQGKRKCHRGGHVDVRVRTAQPRSKSMVAVGIHSFPSDGANTRDQPHVIVHQDEEKHRPEEPEHPLHQVLAEQSAEEIVERLEQPLSEILETGRNQRHFARRRLAEQNDQSDRQPDHDRRVREHPEQRLGIQRQHMVLAFRRRKNRGEARKPGDQDGDKRATSHAGNNRLPRARGL